MSVDEYYKHCSGYSNDYFSGKITEDDREAAAITIDLVIGNRYYVLTRGVFEPEELRELSIRDLRSNKVFLDGVSLSGQRRQQEYEKSIVTDVGLGSFAQFVFLQYFVFTFDERRQLLLWNQNILNQALFLGIGADYAKAQTADALRRERDKAASLARNFSWQASGIRSQIEVLRKAANIDASETDIDEAKAAQKALFGEMQRKQLDAESKRNELNDVELKRMEISARLTTLQAEYNDEFAKRVRERSHIELHPIVMMSSRVGGCALCGTPGNKAIESITTKIRLSHCPLCDSPISNGVLGGESVEKLKSIDDAISDETKNLALTVQTKDRIQSELEASDAVAEGIRKELREFESANEDLLLQMGTKSENVDIVISKRLDEMNDCLKRKDEQYRKRDEKQKELKKLFNELLEQYRQAEKEFVPLFRELASLFIGIDLDIRMEYSSSVIATGLSLQLEMQGEVRRQIHQLSESQRFFLDIALRMALAEYMADQRGKVCLIIDTPEGSLDIAYESRAGQMFASFAQKGNNIIMAANINTSQLLQRMAAMCGHSKMTLHRMISWTGLSDVQLAEEQLFQDAYGQIEAALDKGDK